MEKSQNVGTKSAFTPKKKKKKEEEEGELKCSGVWRKWQVTKEKRSKKIKV